MAVPSSGAPVAGCLTHSRCSLPLCGWMSDDSGGGAGMPVPEAPNPLKETGRNFLPQAPSPWVLKDRIPGIHLLCLGVPLPSTETLRDAGNVLGLGRAH